MNTKGSACFLSNTQKQDLLKEKNKNCDIKCSPAAA